MLKLLNHTKPILFPGNVFKFPNGLTVIHQHLKATPVVVVDVWVKAGAKVEPDNWTGMAHFLEHMIFKGSKRVKPGEFDQRIENTGGVTNAATSHDYAHFFLSTAANYLPDTLPYLAEILLQAEIPELEFYREREVVLEELRYCYDDPDWIGFQALSENIYDHHPYGKSILGEQNQLLNHTPNQMRCFHRTHYQPENMTIAIVGGIDQEKALKLINDYFQDFAVPSECPPLNLIQEGPLVGIKRCAIRLPRLEQARLTMGWRGPGIAEWQKAFGLDLLSVILAGGRTSRLIQQLREEKHLVLDISSGFSLQEDSSLFTLTAWLEPQNLKIVEELMIEAIATLQSEPIAEPELARGKRLLSNDYLFSTETPAQLAGLYGYYQTVANQAELSVNYPVQIQEFQGFQLQEIAKQYLCPDHYVVTTLYPC